MTRFFCNLFLFVFMFFSLTLSAQSQSYREMHKVKKGETIFGIAKQYEITIEELIAANPDMNAIGYELKKGDYIFIPYSSAQKKQKEQKKQATQKTVRVGIMLPLHNVDGDGRRMLEYYRGFLMGCDKLKKEGIGVEVKAWNVPKETDMGKKLPQMDGADGCDVIFGPLYSSQVSALGNFAKKTGAKLVIPFSITGNDVASNANIFQVYQSPQFFTSEVIKNFVARFPGHHVVVIDCNDRQSDKGVFTFGLRKALAAKGLECSVTNLTNSEESFAKAFSTDLPNVVVLNTARSPELNAAFQKLDKLKLAKPGLSITLFGYTEWLMYSKYNTDKYCKYNTYIPTHFYYNPLSSATQSFENDYRARFDQSLMDYMPRFALTGYDHAQFFLRGISRQGKAFTGAEADKSALQTQMHFKRVDGQNSGLQNVGVCFVHYNNNHSISIINY